MSITAKGLTRGVVTDCMWLQIFEKPEAIGEENGVVTSVSALTEVSVDLAESTKDFYKVYTQKGLTGFCGKKYIALAH